MSDSNYNPDTKIWSGKIKPCLYNNENSVGYLILNVLKKTPEQITQVFADTNSEMTCHEMRVRIMKIANHLREIGMQQGDIVGIMATNTENVAPVLFACFTLGVPVNTLAPIMTESDIVYKYSKTKPKVIFCDSNIIETVQKAVDEMNFNPLIYTFMEKVDGFAFVADILEIDLDINSFV